MSADAEEPVDPDVVAADLPSRRIWDIVAVVALGGALGGAAREAVNLALAGHLFPWATLTVNVIGSLLIGVLMVHVINHPEHRYLRPFLGVGVLGGFTTFSAYAVETRGLLVDGEIPLALLYIFGSLLLAFLATWTGLRIGRFVIGEDL